MRVVSLCPSLTELVFDLGAGELLVGRTKFCVHPAGQVQEVERVGGTKTPNVKRILALAPDLVLMNEEENRNEDAEALRAAGVSLHASMPRTAAETAGMVREIGTRLARVEAAEAIAKDIEQRAAGVQARWAGAAPVSYAYLIWREPWMAAGGDTFVAGLLGLAGGVNVFAHGERYPVVTPLELAEARPLRVFLSSEPFPFAKRHIDELVQLTGLPVEAFRLVDGELLSWHGSRTPRGIDHAEAVVRGLA